ncbi:MAG: tetratricopeptide repeat protein, partial [Bdellovibrionales bacterium]|nr:tetratricopeptide repeat protein [Bdellovibrionales bacterium]
MNQSSYLHCPACGREINANRVFLEMAVCECGWTSSLRSRQAEHKRDLRTALTLVAAAGILVLGFIHIIQWDHYAGEILVIKGKELTGMATTTDLERRVDICRERLNHECVAQTYGQLVRRHPQEQKYLAGLGKILSQLGRWKRAAQALRTYVDTGGRDHEMVYEFAKVNAALGQVDEAAKYFDLALSIKPEVLQIQVVRAYV